MTLRPAEFDGDVLALYIADLFQALTEGRHQVRERIGRADMQKADGRHSRLLRARQQRPGRRAA